MLDVKRQNIDASLTQPVSRTFWRSDARVWSMFLVDLAVITFAAQVAWIVRFGPSLLAPDYILVTALAGLCWLALSSNSSLYGIEEQSHIPLGGKRILTAWIYTALLVSVIAFATKSGAGFSRVWAGVWLLTAGIGLLVVRFLWIVASRRAAFAGHFRTRIVIVGDDALSIQALLDLLRQQSETVTIIGIYYLSKHTNNSDLGAEPILGTVSDLLTDYHTLNLDSVWLAVSWGNIEKIDKTRMKLSVLPCEIHAPILPLYNAFPSRSIGNQMGIPTVTLGRQPLSSSDLIFKRAEDICLGLLFLILASPLFLLIAFLIKLDSPGPVFFRQQRHGFANGTFSVFKFRTMFSLPLMENSFKQAIKADPRVTKLGRILRRTSLDELPQLLNVIKGEMSLVGPRPHPIALSDQFIHDVETYLARHKVKPGITGWAQINGLRGETETPGKMAKRVEFDLWYVEHWSVWLDIRIILMTLPALLDKSAY